MAEGEQIGVAPWAYVLAVPDVAHTAAFFRDVLGFAVDWDGAPDWRLATRGTVRVMLGRSPDDLPASRTGSHNWFGYLHISDVDAFHREIAPRGAVCTPPSNKSYGATIVREMMVRTPDGHRMVFGQVLGPDAPQPA